MTDPAKTAATEAPAMPPLLNRNNLLTIAGIVAALWLIAAVSGSLVVTVIIGVLTLVILGGMAYVWRLARKQQNVLAILQSGAGSPEARKAALAQLAKGDDKDVLNRIARAQLEAQDDPDKALVTLESIDLAKVPAGAADEVRTFRAQMYLGKGRLPEARTLADQIRLANASNAASRAMMTAVVAEAWARTDKAEPALVLLNDVKFGDPEVAPVRIPLIMARIFAHYGAGKREKARKDLELLMKDNYQYLGRFTMPGQRVHPELQMIAQEVLKSHPDVKRMAKQQQSQAFRRVR